MPKFTITLPARRSGMRAMYVPEKPPLPGPNVFKGLSAFFTKAPTVFPGPDIFTPFARRSGLAAFRAQVAPAPTFPGPNIFVPFLPCRQTRTHLAKSCGGDCSKCRHAHRRGMGQAETFEVPVDFGTTLYEQAPTFDVPFDFGSTLVNQLPTLSLPSSLNTGTVSLGPSSNPSLDAFNQALTDARANPYSTAANLTASQLAQLGNIVASAKSPQQISTAAQQVSGSTLNTSVSGFFKTYGTYLLLGGAGIFAVKLLSQKKGRR